MRSGSSGRRGGGACAASARAAGAAAPLMMLAMLAVALASGACAPELDWREVRVPGHAVGATLPCKPEVSVRTVPLAGQPVRLTMAACKAAELTWALAAAEVGDPARVGPALHSLRDAMLVNLGGQVVESRPAAVRGATPHEAQMRVQVRGRRQDGSAASAHLIVFSHGTQVFRAVVMGEPEAEGPTASFFDSLRAGA